MVPVRDSSTSQALTDSCECSCRRLRINVSTCCGRASGKSLISSITPVTIACLRSASAWNRILVVLNVAFGLEQLSIFDTAVGFSLYKPVTVAETRLHFFLSTHLQCLDWKDKRRSHRRFVLAKVMGSFGQYFRVIHHLSKIKQLNPGRYEFL
jgi:hypothetical protein